MPRMHMSEQEREAFLAEPRIGVLSVANGSQRPPLTVPLWYGYQPGGHITFFTGTAGRKANKVSLIRQARMVSLCVQQSELPYKYVTVEGSVVRVDQPPQAQDMLAIVGRYLPEAAATGFVQAELAHPSGTLVLFTIRPDRWLSADFSGNER